MNDIFSFIRKKYTIVNKKIRKRQNKTEQILTDIRNNYSHLFLECERSKSWLYKTTEDIGQSNTEKLIDVIIEAKSSYDYLYKKRENELLNEKKLII